MFKNLFVFEKERNVKEAFGFYLAYLLLIILLGALLGGFLANGFEEGVAIGSYSAIGFCLVLSFTVLFKKNQQNNFGLVLVAFLSGPGAFLLGGLLGLVPTAYLTTKKDKSSR